MCGICGISRLDADAPELRASELDAMMTELARRGPDGRGQWSAPDRSTMLGHLRLAILDLSDAGAQPMASRSGRYRLVFNGEIYNFRELRAALEAEGVRFDSASDTEVLLALWEREGRASLARLRGMFALAIHDERERTITLARDPFGIKPLYYATEGGLLRFASQVKALEAAGVSREVDPAGLVSFLLWGAVQEPGTIRRSVRAVPAGSCVVFAERSGQRVGQVSRFAATALDVPDATPFSRALGESVRAHLVSDVPVALFLSAGVDSAAVAAIATGAFEDPKRLTTFTVRFEGWEGGSRDEGPLARRVAEALGTRHVERVLSRRDVEEAWPRLVRAMDQPSIDGLNTWLVSRAAADAGIRVALSGLGGDELLGGYPSFRDVPRWTRRARALRAIPGSRRIWRGSIAPFARARPKLPAMLDIGDTISGSYFLRRGLFLPEELPAILGPELAREGLALHDPVAYAEDRRGGDAASSVESAEWRDVQRLERRIYLRNQLLRDSDWASMDSSLELRVPFVDPRLWAAQREQDRMSAQRQGKAAVLREALGADAARLPSEVWNRPKTGFSVPVAEWVAPAGTGDRRGSVGGGSRRLALRLLETWGVA